VSVPREKEYLLSVPLLIFFVNVLGVAYMSFSGNLSMNREIVDALAPYKGQYVLLDKSIFQCDGFFDRFDIKQKFTDSAFSTNPLLGWAEPLLERYTGRPAFGSNIAFEEDIPPLPDLPVVFSNKNANFWLTMSEGVIFYGSGKQVLWKLSPTLRPDSKPETGWNYAEKIKFYMKLEEKPAGDMEFCLTAVPQVTDGKVLGQRMTIYANNLQIGEWIWNRPEASEKRVHLPKAILEESYNDVMHLLTLTLHIRPLDPDAGSLFNLKLEKMEFRHKEVS
jgi:hypothetical protein